MKPIQGDPLTGSLPVTRVVRLDLDGSVRRSRDKLSWPLVQEHEYVSEAEPGLVAYVRTRFGVRQVLVRMICRSHARGRNRGRRYLVGMTRNGWCAASWLDAVIKVETAAQALAAGKAIASERP